MHTGSSTIHQIMAPLVRGKFWMKLLGVMMIISGVLQVFSVIGILWAWIPIWLGILLFQSVGAAERASVADDVGAAEQATDRLRLFFMIQGILMLVALILFGLALAFGGFAMIATLMGAGSF